MKSEKFSCLLPLPTHPLNFNQKRHLTAPLGSLGQKFRGIFSTPTKLLNPSRLFGVFSAALRMKYAVTVTHTHR